MNNEKWRYNTVTLYIDEETGETIAKELIGTDYIKTTVLDLQIRTDFENHIKNVFRTVGVKTLPAKQLKLWK